jgi:hypothetical protein
VSWIEAANKWEAANADYMSNPLRAATMQRAISEVAAQAKAKNEALSYPELLKRAGAAAFEYDRYTPPTDPKAKEAVKDALAARKPEKPEKTLGDAPTAGQDAGGGDSAFEKLDDLPIDQLEEALSNMSEAQRERYLAAAEGANARGRGVDKKAVKA